MLNRIVLFCSCLILPLLGGCSLNGLDKVPQSYGLSAEHEDDWYNFPPDFPMDSIVETSRDMDIAIIGEGFFLLNDLETSETVYTRQGHFNIDAYGCFVVYITLPSEDPTVSYLLPYPLTPDMFIFPGTEKILILDTGMVWAWALQGTDGRWKPIGQIELATFAHPEGLQQVGENLYRETEASGQATVNVPGTNGTGTLKTRYLEVFPNF